MAYAQLKESVPEKAQKAFLLWRIDGYILSFHSYWREVEILYRK